MVTSDSVCHFFYYFQWHATSDIWPATSSNWKIHFTRQKMQQIKTWHVTFHFSLDMSCHFSLDTSCHFSFLTSIAQLTCHMLYLTCHLQFKFMCGGNTDKWFSMSLLCITCSDMQQVTYDVSHLVIERNTVQDKWHNKSKLWFCNTSCDILLLTCITHV
jgi:hypothetical protein